MNRSLKKVVWFVMIAPAIYLTFVWNKIPEKVAMHFDIHGNADKFGNKKEFLFFIGILTVVTAGIYLLFTNIYRIDPKKYAAANKDRLQKIVFALTVFFSAIGCYAIYLGVSGSLKLNVHIAFALMGLFWAVIGNYMNNVKPNYFVGFRLPWTVENEDNWRHTHHLASKLWFAGGLLITIICIFTSTSVAIITIFSVLLIATTIPTIYSYWFYKKQKSTQTKNKNQLK